MIDFIKRKIDWIKDKLHLMKFHKRPLKIRSYTDVVKERVFPEIDGFRSLIWNINPDYAEEGIKLLDQMEINITEHQLAWRDIYAIKRYVYEMRHRFHPNNYYQSDFSGFGQFFGGFYKGNCYQEYQNQYANWR